MKIFLFLIFILPLAACKNNNEQYDISFDDDFSASAYDIALPSEPVTLNSKWEFASFSKINTGQASLYTATENRKDFIIAVNAGHGTIGGASVMTYSHPDRSPKLTGGTNPKGAVESVAVSGGMTFRCGLSESEVNLRVAIILRKLLLEEGFDVLMIRETDDVQLDNIARTVISNNKADIHIAIHFDGDGKSSDKGSFYCGIPDKLCFLENVAKHRPESEKLGSAIIDALRSQGIGVYASGRIEIDLTQTSYSTIPTVDIELGNQCTIPTTLNLENRAKGILHGIMAYAGSVPTKNP